MELVSLMIVKMNKHLMHLLIGTVDETKALNGISNEFKETHDELVQLLLPSSSTLPSNSNTVGSIL